MKGMKENIDYINDIIDSIDKINQFTINLELDDFIKDVKTNYADVNAQDNYGKTALIHSINENHLEIADLLKAAGAVE